MSFKESEKYRLSRLYSIIAEFTFSYPKFPDYFSTKSTSRNSGDCDLDLQIYLDLDLIHRRLCDLIHPKLNFLKGKT